MKWILAEICLNPTNRLVAKYLTLQSSVLGRNPLKILFVQKHLFLNLKMVNQTLAE